jgi:hypothetical protein
MPPSERFSRHSQLCTPGLVSRSGWVLVDDTQRPRFDTDPEWPWVTDPPSRPAFTFAPDGSVAEVLRQDW